MREDRGVTGEKVRERRDTTRSVGWTRGCERGGARREAGGRQGDSARCTATPERAINDSGAEFRDAEILSV